MTAEHPKYLLRWCFEYADHKPRKFGMWSHPGDFDTEKAWCQSKENLLRACIEGKDFLTREIMVLAELPGPDFVNFQWIAKGVQRGDPRGEKVPWRILGLMLVSRDQKIKIYDTGMVENEKHNIDYGRINLSGFGR